MAYTHELMENRETLDQVCRAIVSVLGVDITIVDSEFRRITGTGRYRESTGTVLKGIGVFNYALLTRKSKIVENPRAHEICLPCANKSECKEYAQVCCPILLDDEVIGVMGLAAFDEVQKQRLLSNKDKMLDFVENMALLIVSKVREHIETQKVSVMAGELRLLFDSMESAILTTDKQGNILRTNRLADELLALENLPKDSEGAVSGQKGVRLNIQDLEGFSESFDLREIEKHGGLLNNIEFNYKKNNSQQRGFYSVRPVMSETKHTGYLFTLSRIHQILRVVDAVSGGQLPTAFSDILGSGRVISGLKAYAASISSGGSTVLIQGETGTGKELFARAIHNESKRKGRAFIAINCAAIPESLMESELFGYDEGAFTGARRGGRMGKFELASGGTIFLDEIGDMPLNLQTKLLRVLQEGVVERVGGNRGIPVDVRVIAATNKDLETMVEELEFRKDLFYRLNVMPLYLPALRERQEDIEVLALAFLKKYADKLNKTITNLSPEVRKSLEAYPWPGNIRELENTIEYAVNVCRGEKIGIENLPRRLREASQSSVGENRLPIKTLAELEKEAILSAVAACETIDQAAEVLGVGRATVFRKLKQYQNDTEISI